MNTVLLWAAHRLGEHASTSAAEERSKPLLISSLPIPEHKNKLVPLQFTAESANSDLAMSGRFVVIELVNYTNHRLIKPQYYLAEGETTLPPPVTVLSHLELPNYPWSARFQAKTLGPTYGVAGCLVYRVADTDGLYLGVLWYNPEDYVTRRQGNKYAVHIMDVPTKEDGRVIPPGPKSVYQDTLSKKIWVNAGAGKPAHCTEGPFMVSAFMGDADQATMRIELWCSCNRCRPVINNPAPMS